MAKLFSQRATFERMDACLQIHAGAGYMRDYFIERAVRRALGRSAAAANEIMR